MNPFRHACAGRVDYDDVRVREYRAFFAGKKVWESLTHYQEVERGKLVGHPRTSIQEDLHEP